ncbi:MAG: Protein FecR, ferric citrate sensor [Nitrospira sp.]|nr:FecR family protein [Nitrospira sp.]ULA62113.1 MAG: Protein FecR, ferric citrate sensor [Nitrospira sp.]
MSSTSTPDPEAHVIKEASEWFARLRATDVTPREQDAFTQWKAQHPTHEEAYDALCRLWAKLEEPSHAAFRAERPIASPSGHSPPTERNPSASRILGGKRSLVFAAVIALLTTVAALWIPHALHRWKSDVSTEAGEQRHLNLADGSTVLLNTQSALAIGTWRDRREVTLLKGEAAFSVTPDPEKPFIVAAGPGTVQVVGTKFSIRKHPDRVTVTVSEGTVTIHATVSADPVRVQAGQEVSYDTQGIGPIRNADFMKALAWQRGQLVFTMEPLSGVIDELNRYHSGAMILANPALRPRVVSGVFATNDPLRVLDAITQTLHVRSLSIAGRVVLLY